LIIETARLTETASRTRLTGMKFKEALGEVLREQRLAKSLTMRQVSERGHLSYSFLSEVERGIKDCSSDFITAIANGLGVESYDLIIEAGYRMAGDRTIVPDTPESLFLRDSRWASQYSDLVK
jgi:transcriptional regulator with XRE-family HTH domain